MEETERKGYEKGYRREKSERTTKEIDDNKIARDVTEKEVFNNA